MREGVSLSFNCNVLRWALLLFCIHETNCNQVKYGQGSILMGEKGNAMLPAISPSTEPHPFPYFPSQAPSALIPFTNRTVPRLSGVCRLNFSAVESMMSMATFDCFLNFAPILANVLCCPQVEATLTILVGQFSKHTSILALDDIHAENCLSDFEQILESQGADTRLKKICSISPSNLTEGSCPVKDVDEFENIVDSSKLLSACENIDPVNECCTQVCQGMILEAAKNITSRYYSFSSVGHLAKIEDCESIVLRWLASRLDPIPAKKVLRGLSNCNLNKACPLVLPSVRNVSKNCGNGVSNKTACCRAMKSYVSHLQKQRFITNLQALECTSLLGMKLQKANVSKNVYSLCHITLKDFSLQKSGCLLPSLPSDATFDPTSGISFVCDLNDNIAAPWPSASLISSSSCNKTTKIPALPAATSAQQSGFDSFRVIDVEKADAVTVIKGMRAALDGGFAKVIFLFDCQRLVKAFEEKSIDLTWGALSVFI
ncbi:hypothetical protein GIB67_027010 [Kingdonia uniflora]|uniref:SPARK domain-containing protein n=1 Tax=Kingdonia uniflora TaxID=39325 RepID=A0A7J7P1K4_9MAGN|nr:hypothetical protein GIB67_027010 [Kingdonia uniflora]